MAIFPVIQSQCPYKGNLSDIMDGDVCRLCKRQVFDLTDMNDRARVAFFKDCSSEICVSYRLPAKVALAAVIAIASAGAPMAAAACDVTTVVVTAGGIKDPANIKFVENSGDKAIPALPVVYEADGRGQSHGAAQSDVPDDVPANVQSGSPASP